MKTFITTEKDYYLLYLYALNGAGKDLKTSKIKSYLRRRQPYLHVILHNVQPSLLSSHYRGSDFNQLAGYESGVWSIKDQGLQFLNDNADIVNDLMNAGDIEKYLERVSGVFNNINRSSRGTIGPNSNPTKPRANNNDLIVSNYGIEANVNDVINDPSYIKKESKWRNIDAIKQGQNFVNAELIDTGADSPRQLVKRLCQIGVAMEKELLYSGMKSTHFFFEGSDKGVLRLKGSELARGLGRGADFSAKLRSQESTRRLLANKSTPESNYAGCMLKALEVKEKPVVIVDVPTPGPLKIKTITKPAPVNEERIAKAGFVNGVKVFSSEFEENEHSRGEDKEQRKRTGQWSSCGTARWIPVMGWVAPEDFDLAVKIQNCIRAWRERSIQVATDMGVEGEVRVQVISDTRWNWLSDGIIPVQILNEFGLSINYLTILETGDRPAPAGYTPPIYQPVTPGQLPPKVKKRKSILGHLAAFLNFFNPFKKK